ncbi:GntR family transcriptional regulator [Streptomyces sp. NPDC003077]|uniref:GntR family transcriptional regulator n=1 Tax=Streptomyces sp. NPDC003077 TaxID=3154443 RepID=UPI0033BB124F
MGRSAVPPYVQIADEIRRRIAAGELGVGDRVPSTRQITREWGVAMATATKVLTVLRQEGLVRAVPGVGTVVAGPPRGVRPMLPAKPGAGDPETGPATLHPHPPKQQERPEPPARRPLPREHRRRSDPDQGLSRDRIVRAGIRVADAEGLRAMSMRRVAAEFGVSSMALYRHVANKDELLMLMADELFREVVLPDPAPEDWRGRMEAGARLQWDLYERHPWVAHYLTITRPQPMPNAMALAEWTLARTPGLDPLTKLHMATSLLTYVRGAAVNLADDREAEQETGMSNEEWMAFIEPLYERTVSTGAYPMYARIGELDEAEINLYTIFNFGLARLLDGFGLLIEGRGGLEGRKD